MEGGHGHPGDLQGLIPGITEVARVSPFGSLCSHPALFRTRDAQQVPVGRPLSQMKRGPTSLRASAPPGRGEPGSEAPGRDGGGGVDGVWDWVGIGGGGTGESLRRFRGLPTCIPVCSSCFRVKVSYEDMRETGERSLSPFPRLTLPLLVCSC